MVTIVLDYNDGKVFLINHSAEEDVEKLIFDKFDFYESGVEWMTLDKFNIETLQ